MNIKVNKLDLSNMDESETVKYIKKLDELENAKLYTRNDLEQLENYLPGTLSDLEGFDIKEYSAIPSDANISIFRSRIREVKKLISENSINKYNDYISDVEALHGMLKLVENEITHDLKKNHIMDKSLLDNVLLGYPRTNLNEYNLLNFNKDTLDNILYISDDNNIYLVKAKLNQIISRVDFNDNSGQILKILLDKDTVTIDDLIEVLGNPLSTLVKINDIRNSVLDSLYGMKDALECVDYINDEVLDRWMKSSMIINKYIPISDDNLSLALFGLAEFLAYGEQ